MNFEAALAALEARMTSKLAMLERDVQSGLYSRPPDMPWLGGGADSPHDFDPRFDGENIYRTAGHRCIIGLHDDWELLDEVPVTLTEDGNGTYWMRWVYTTDEAPGSFTEGYGTPPTQDTTCTVALLWTITDGVVKYHERGAKRFFDWDKC